MFVPLLLKSSEFEDDTSLYSWGTNSYGQLGLELACFVSKPVSMFLSLLINYFFGNHVMLLLYIYYYLNIFIMY